MKTTSTLATVLSGLSKTSLGVGGISFFVGGGLIHAETHMDRFSAELLGMAIAAVGIILGMLLKGLADNLQSVEEDQPVNTRN